MFFLFGIFGIVLVFVSVRVMIFVFIGTVIGVKIVFAHEFIGLEVVVVPLPAVAAIGHLERVFPIILVFCFFLFIIRFGRAKRCW